MILYFEKETVPLSLFCVPGTTIFYMFVRLGLPRLEEFMLLPKKHGTCHWYLEEKVKALPATKERSLKKEFSGI